MDEQAREEFFRVKKAHRVAVGCAKVTFCLVKSGFQVVEKKKIKMQKEKAEHRKSSKKKSWMGQDELVV